MVGNLRVDLDAECVWLGDRERPLRARSFAVLRHLVRNRGRLVTKEELFRACWPGTSVSHTVLRVCITEIRAALGDDARSPGFVATVGRRGYRFAADPDAPTPAGRLAGRDGDLRALRALLANAREGRRQLVFVIGEPGLGKTALIDCFLDELRADGRVRVAQGQSVELAAGNEPYLALLDTLGQLAAGPDGPAVVATLERWAPSWLLQMPAFVDAGRSADLRRRVPGLQQHRMLRELAEALEALAAERPLVLALEDLHWSDPSMVDALAFLAQRRTPACLLVIGSYRSVDLAISDHPLKAVKQSLHARGRCRAMALELLTPAQVGECLSWRLRGHPLDPALPVDIHRRTDGNPLFVVAMVDFLLSRGLLAVGDGRWRSARTLDGILPETLQELVERELGSLEPPARRVLEAASVAGIEFPVAAVASAASFRPDTVEGLCADLATRGQLVRAAGVATWPDGTTTGCYEFRHGLYREVLYQRLSGVRRRRLHGAVGERLEAGYCGSTGELAATLASHFALGGDNERAVRYHTEAADLATTRFAERETVAHLQAALERLRQLPATPSRAREELSLLTRLAPALLITQGYAAPEVGDAYARAYDLCQRLGDQAHAATLLLGRGMFHVTRAENQTAYEIARTLLAEGWSLGDTAVLLGAHFLLGCARLFQGRADEARTHLEEGLASYARKDDSSLGVRYGQDPEVTSLSVLAWAVWMLGYADQARRRTEEALDLARRIAHPFTLAYALLAATWTYRELGDARKAEECADECATIARDHGFRLFDGHARIWGGWALAAQGRAEEGLRRIEEGLAAYWPTEERTKLAFRTFFIAVKAETENRLQKPAQALALLDAALTALDQREERLYEPELHRLKGLALLHMAGEAEAEASFHRALAIARHQQAKAFELRAAMDLARLYRRRGKRDEARRLVEGVYHSFSEGFGTADLRAAKALIDALGNHPPARWARRRAPKTVGGPRADGTSDG